jgi:hypothetical protein
VRRSASTPDLSRAVSLSRWMLDGREFTRAFVHDTSSSLTQIQESGSTYESEQDLYVHL